MPPTTTHKNNFDAINTACNTFLASVGPTIDVNQVALVKYVRSFQKGLVRIQSDKDK